MSTAELIKEITKLPIDERLLLVVETIKSIRKSSDEKTKRAVEIMTDEYKNNKELTALTDLDFEEFYEPK
jgi:hypothetical protein